MKHTISHLFLFLVLISFAACTITKQTTQRSEPSYIPADKALYDTIARQDSLLFAAFNSRNLGQMGNYFTEDLQVYQDNIGVRNY